MQRIDSRDESETYAHDQFMPKRTEPTQNERSSVVDAQKRGNLVAGQLFLTKEERNRKV